jgi:hypothetical protein
MSNCKCCGCVRSRYGTVNLKQDDLNPYTATREEYTYECCVTCLESGCPCGGGPFNNFIATGAFKSWLQ